MTTLQAKAKEIIEARERLPVSLDAIGIEQVQAWERFQILACKDAADISKAFLELVEENTELRKMSASGRMALQIGSQKDKIAKLEEEIRQIKKTKDQWLREWRFDDHYPNDELVSKGTVAKLEAQLKEISERSARLMDILRKCPCTLDDKCLSCDAMSEARRIAAIADSRIEQMEKGGVDG